MLYSMAGGVYLQVLVGLLWPELDDYLLVWGPKDVFLEFWGSFRALLGSPTRRPEIRRFLNQIT